MPDLLLYPLAFLLVLAGIVYLFAPLKVRETQTVPREAGMTPVDPTDANLTPEAQEHIRQSTVAFVEEGFLFLGFLRAVRPATGGHSYVALLADDAHGRLAQVAFLLSITTARDTPIITRQTGIILETYYASGQVVQSSTFPSSGIYKSLPNHWGISFHGFFSDAASLLRQHKNLELRRAQGPTKPSGASANPAAFMNQVHREVMQTQANHGYYTLDEKAALYRLTFKGAYLITWKLLPPWKQLKQFAARRQTRRWMIK